MLFSENGVIFLRSLWEQTAKQECFSALDKNISTDVLIIGGGLCGLLCAYLLQEAGIDYALVEAETICSGITKNTTAKITAQHGLIYQNLLHNFGMEKAKQYLSANEAALHQYRQLCRTIDCSFESRDSYVYSLNNRKKIEREAAALQTLGANAAFCESVSLPFPVSGAVMLKNQAQFDPLQFTAELSRNLKIYEHTRVRELIGTKAVTSGGTIQAKRIIVATHFPFINKHGLYSLKLYQHRSYVT